jgi:calcium-translocating P-type ATPase
MVLARLAVGPDGLTLDRVDARRQPQPESHAPVGLRRALVEELANPLTPVLAVAAGLSTALGGIVDAAIVVAVAAAGALIGARQRQAADRAVAGLGATSPLTVRVRRDGVDRRLPATELVPGDLITLTAGDVVPADCRVLDGTGLEADESTLTGESLPVRKSPEPVLSAVLADRTSMLYAGTLIAAGRGTAVVVATGTATEAGRGLAAAAAPPPTSGVEVRLRELTAITVPTAVAAGATLIGAGLLRGQPSAQALNSGVALAVAAVPEGLPFMATAAQLAAARRLSARGALVRNARTIEALGRVQVLCFDKTGTLTEGRISLGLVSAGPDPQHADRLDDTGRLVLATALRAAPRRRRGRPVAGLTDRAVVTAAENLGIDRTLGAEGWHRVALLPFQPARGYFAALARTGLGGVLSVKGAPEVVLPRCTRWQPDPAGGETDRELNEVGRAELSRRLQRLTEAGYRVLAVAERTADPDGELDDAVVAGLRFTGFLALADPVRETARRAVAQLSTAGVQLVMITGDHPSTAEAIAADLGLLNGGRVLTGPQLDALADAELDRLLPSVTVCARVTPAHKVRVVQALQRIGRPVAMTGDGANDAPAIRLADVGIALGARGTTAARAAADLVVTDDRLETIVDALVEGRAMWASVRQALGILVGGNLGEIAFTVAGGMVIGRSPLSARQLLLVNLLTDLTPSVVVAVRPPGPTDNGRLLAEGPETSLGAALTREVTVRAVSTASAASVAWLIARLTGRRARADTIALATLVSTQLAQTILIARRGSPWPSSYRPPV